MDIRLKNTLGGVIIAALILTSLGIWQWSQAYSRSTPAAATFSVSGSGKSVGTPDVAQFTFSIISEGGKDVGALQKDNVEKTNAAIDYVKSQGVDAKDIQTLGYNIEPRYTSCNPQPLVYSGVAASSGGSSGANMTRPASAPVTCPPASIAGYTVTQTVQVKVRDFGKVGAILAGVASKGANNVSGLSFTVDNPSALTNEARAKAIQDAKDQASAMAKAGGFHLGRLISVSENSYNPVYDKSYYSAAPLGAGAGAPAPTIEPGSQTISSQVTLTYEID